MRYSKETQDRIVELYKIHSMRQIATILRAEGQNASRNSIRTVLHRRGVTLRPPCSSSAEFTPPRVDPRLAPILKYLYWEQEMNIAEIERFLEWRPGSGRHRMISLGIPRRSKEEVARIVFRNSVAPVLRARFPECSTPGCTTLVSKEGRHQCSTCWRREHYVPRAKRLVA